MDMQHRVCVTVTPSSSKPKLRPFDLVFYGIPIEHFLTLEGRTLVADRLHKRGFIPGHYPERAVRCMSQHEAQPPHGEDRHKEGRARAYEWRDRRGRVHQMEQLNHEEGSAKRYG